MSLPSSAGGRYRLPDDYLPDSVGEGSLPADFDQGYTEGGRPPPISEVGYENVPYDLLPIQETGAWMDRGYADPGSQNTNPDGADAGPMYVSPHADQWLEENVYGRGYLVDWGNREVYDAKTGENVGYQVPRTFGPMI